MASFFNMTKDLSRFRWITTVSDDDGRRLTRVRFDPVAALWVPPRVDWIPGNPQDKIGDFPVFHPWVHAVSRRALEAIRPFVESDVEVLPLRGLADQYVAIHCIRWTEVISIDGDPYHPDADIRLDWYLPTLREKAIGGRDFVCDPRAPGRLFCSEQLRDAILNAKLRGLIFKPVELS